MGSSNVSFEKYESLEARFAALEARNNALEARNARLRTDNDRLYAENVKLKTHMRTLQDEHAKELACVLAVKMTETASRSV